MAIEFGPCDDEGYRDIHLVSELTPSTPEDMIQWIVDGVPFGPVQKPGLYVGRVLGDGEFHQIELHIVAPEDASGDVERIQFPACDEPKVSARIASIDFGECDADGKRPIRVTSRVSAPEGEPVSLQWLVDGEPFGEAVGPGAHVGTIVGDGNAHTIEVRVISPEGGTGDIRDVTIPECDKPVEAHIRSIDFGDCDPEGYRPVRLVPQLVPADATDVIVQWFIDGEPFGPEGPPTAVTGKLKGDGNRHDVELRVIAPDGAKGDTEAVEIPVCERVQVRIRSVDFAECDDEGNRPVRLISAVIPGDTQDVTVQWVIDGELFGEPGPIGTFTGKVKGDGKTHQIELRVVAPEGAEGDTEQVDIPECEPSDIYAEITPIERLPGRPGRDPNEPCPGNPLRCGCGRLNPELAVCPVDEFASMIDCGELEPVPALDELPDDLGYLPPRGVDPVEALQRVNAALREIGIDPSELDGDETELDGDERSPLREDERRELENFDPSTFVGLSALLGLASYPPVVTTTTTVVDPVLNYGSQPIDDFPYHRDGEDEDRGSEEQCPSHPEVGCPEDKILYADKVWPFSDAATPPRPNLRPVIVESCTHVGPGGGNVHAADLGSCTHVSAAHPGEMHPVLVKKPGLFGFKVQMMLCDDIAANYPASHVIGGTGSHLVFEHPREACPLNDKPCVHGSEHTLDFVRMGDGGSADNDKFNDLLAQMSVPYVGHSPSFWENVLHPDLQPETGVHLKDNLYFVNGMGRKWHQADGQRQMIANFFNAPKTKLIYNNKEGQFGKETDGKEVAWEYQWLFSGPNFDRTFGHADIPDSAEEVTAVIAVLYNAFAKKVGVGLVATSHGTLITAQAIVAFAKMYPHDGIAWMRSSVRLLHVGCVVPKESFALLRSLCEHYEMHADPRDPVARVMGDLNTKVLQGYLLAPPPFVGGYVYGAAAVAFAKYVRPPKNGSYASMRTWQVAFNTYLGILMSKPAVLMSAKKQVVGLSGIVDPHHHIAKSYLTQDLRHAKRDYFNTNASNAADAAKPVTSLQAVIRTQDAKNAGVYSKVWVTLGSYAHAVNGGALVNFAKASTETVNLTIPPGMTAGQIAGSMTVTISSPDGWKFRGIELLVNGSQRIVRNEVNKTLTNSKPWTTAI